MSFWSWNLGVRSLEQREEDALAELTKQLRALPVGTRATVTRHDGVAGDGRIFTLDVDGVLEFGPVAPQKVRDPGEPVLVLDSREVPAEPAEVPPE